MPIHVVALPNGFASWYLAYSSDYSDTEYFNLIHSNNMKMLVILAINFNRMDKAIGHIAGNVWKYDIKDHVVRCPRSRIENGNQNIIPWKLVPECLRQICNRTSWIQFTLGYE